MFQDKKRLFFLILIGVGIIAYTYSFYDTSNVKREVPYYQQEKDYYCGEACIQMILGYYQINPLPSQNEIALETKYSNNQTSISNMGIPFTKRNMSFQTNSTSDYDLAYKRLIDTVSNKPVIILLIWNDNTGHYLVVYDRDSSGIKYHDPLQGKSLYKTKEELKIYWHDNYDLPWEPCWILYIK